MSPEFFGMLGLAMRAGKLVSGEGKVTDAIRGGKAKLLLLAEDVSQNSAQKFIKMAESRALPCIRCEGMERMGRAIGRPFAATIAVLDASFAAQLQKLAQS